MTDDFLPVDEKAAIVIGTLDEVLDIINSRKHPFEHELAVWCDPRKPGCVQLVKACCELDTRVRVAEWPPSPGYDFCAGLIRMNTNVVIVVIEATEESLQ